MNCRSDVLIRELTSSGFGFADSRRAGTRLAGAGRGSAGAVVDLCRSWALCLHLSPLLDPMRGIGDFASTESTG